MRSRSKLTTKESFRTKTHHCEWLIKSFPKPHPFRQTAERFPGCTSVDDYLEIKLHKVDSHSEMAKACLSLLCTPSSWDTYDKRGDALTPPLTRLWDVANQKCPLSGEGFGSVTPRTKRMPSSLPLPFCFPCFSSRKSNTLFRAKRQTMLRLARHHVLGVCCLLFAIPLHTAQRAEATIGFFTYPFSTTTDRQNWSLYGPQPTTSSVGLPNGDSDRPSPQNPLSLPNETTKLPLFTTRLTRRSNHIIYYTDRE